MLKFTHITESVKLVFRRFPLSMINAILGTVAGIIIAHDVSYISNEDFLYRIVMTTVLGFLLLTSIQLYNERHPKEQKKNKIITYTAVLFLAVYYLLLPYDFDYASQEFIIRFILFGIGFLFSVTFAPFIKSFPSLKSISSEINGFWQHNKAMVIRLFFTGLFTGVLFFGLVLALASIDNLLGIDVYDELYLEMWIFIVGIIATIFFLSGMETDSSRLEKKTDYPKGIKVFSQYILTPLLILYGLIIATYFVKVIVTDEWPKGMIVYLIFVFSFMGILAYFLLYPLRDKEESRWVKWFSRFLFVTIIPFTGMLFWAVQIRIAEYGLTERRYYVVVLGIWLLCTSVYFLFRKQQNIKLIPISLFLIALLTSFGPWGAISVSEANQVGTLETILTENGILVDGKIHKADSVELSREDLGRISGILDYLTRVHTPEAIQPWFEKDLTVLKEGDGECRYSGTCMMDLMGLTYIPQWERKTDFDDRIPRDYISFYTEYETTIDVSGYRFLTSFSIGRGQDEGIYPLKINEDLYTIDFSNEKILFVKDSKNQIVDRFDVFSFVQELIQSYSADNSIPLPPEKLRMNGENTALVFRNINLRNISKDPLSIDYIEGVLLVK